MAHRSSGNHTQFDTKCTTNSNNFVYQSHSYTTLCVKRTAQSRSMLCVANCVVSFTQIQKMNHLSDCHCLWLCLRPTGSSANETHTLRIFVCVGCCCTTFPLDNRKYHVRVQVEINLRSRTPYRGVPPKQSERDSKNDFTSNAAKWIFLCKQFIYIKANLFE